MKIKELHLTETEQRQLADNKTLVFGDEVPQYVLMPYSKYASLVAEADSEKIQARLKID